MSDCLPRSFPPGSTSFIIVPNTRELCRDLCAGLRVSLLSLLCGKAPTMALPFEEHVVGDQELGAGPEHGTCPGQVLKLLYKHPARLDDK